MEINVYIAESDAHKPGGFEMNSAVFVVDKGLCFNRLRKLPENFLLFLAEAGVSGTTLRMGLCPE